MPIPDNRHAHANPDANDRRQQYFIYIDTATGEVCIGCDHHPTAPFNPLRVQEQTSKKFVLAPPTPSPHSNNSSPNQSPNPTLYTTTTLTPSPQNLRITIVYNKTEIWLYSLPSDALALALAQGEGRILSPPQTSSTRTFNPGLNRPGGNLDHIFVFRAGGGSALETPEFVRVRSAGVCEGQGRLSTLWFRHRARSGGKAGSGCVWPVVSCGVFVGSVQEGVAGLAVFEEGVGAGEGLVTGLVVWAFDCGGRERMWRCLV